MSRATLAAAIAAAAMLAAAPAAGAGAIWTNTPHNVRSILLDRWNTSDGEPLSRASCRGMWSYPHLRTHRGMEFHRLRCTEWDDLNRRFDVQVTVRGGGFALRVQQIACNDSRSDYACP